MEAKSDKLEADSAELESKQYEMKLQMMDIDSKIAKLDGSNIQIG